jgi:hypothetical protein
VSVRLRAFTQIRLALLALIFEAAVRVSSFPLSPIHSRWLSDNPPVVLNGLYPIKDRRPLREPKPQGSHILRRW